MACEYFSNYLRQAGAGILVGLVVWTVTLIALSTVPLNGGTRLGYYTPTGLLTVQTFDDDGSVAFRRQMLPN